MCLKELTALLYTLQLLSNRLMFGNGKMPRNQPTRLKNRVSEPLRSKLDTVPPLTASS